jgi:hypothetical protein
MTGVSAVAAQKRAARAPRLDRKGYAENARPVLLAG